MIMKAIRRMFGGDEGPGDEGAGDGRSEAASTGAGGLDDAECSGGEGVNCREALEQIYEFLDGELEDVDRGAIEAHFEKCAACYPHLALEKSFREKVNAALRRDACPETVRNRVMEILRGDAPG